MVWLILLLQFNTEICLTFQYRELDHAMLRRLEKRIIVDLPTYEARKKMFMHHLPPIVIKEENGLVLSSDLDYDRLAEVYI
jgi:katanin p60 ATPase-containing subunit A1